MADVVGWPLMSSSSVAVSFTVGVLADRRVLGVDAPAVAAVISQLSFAAAGSVFVTGVRASEQNTGAGPAAAMSGAPLLLADGDALPAVTAREIRQLGASRVVLVGSPEMVSDQVARTLGAMGCAVERATGSDAFCFPSLAYVVGDSYPERLVAEAMASSRPGPVLAVRRAGIPAGTAAELDRLSPARIVVAAGMWSVGDEVLEVLDAGADAWAHRLPGCDRYVRSASMALAAFPPSTPVFLRAGAGAVVVHTPGSVPIPAAAAIDSLKPSIVAAFGDLAHGSPS